jgi:hypothetical protein
MTTVCYPGSGRLTASFAPVAIHYGAGVDICPGRHGPTAVRRVWAGGGAGEQ